MRLRFSLGDALETQRRIDRKLPNSSGWHLTGFSEERSGSGARSHHFPPSYQVRFSLFGSQNGFRRRRVRRLGIGIYKRREGETHMCFTRSIYSFWSFWRPSSKSSSLWRWPTLVAAHRVTSFTGPTASACLSAVQTHGARRFDD